MPLSLVVRTTVGTPAAISGAVDEAIAAFNAAAGVHWRRGAAVDPPTQLSTADRQTRPPVGELWVVGDPRRYPKLPPGTYASSVIERVRGGMQMPVSTLVVIGDAPGNTTGQRPSGATPCSTSWATPPDSTTTSRPGRASAS
jgi:hypothetical protein